MKTTRVQVIGMCDIIAFKQYIEDAFKQINNEKGTDIKVKYQVLEPNADKNMGFGYSAIIYYSVTE